MAAPRQMKAVLVEEFGEAEKMKIKTDAPVPTVVEGKVLVRLYAAGINELELRIRSKGWRGFIAPCILGMDGAGVVECVGDDVTTCKRGDRVYVCQPITGTYAEYCLADADRVYELHEKLSFEEGALLPIPYFSALHALTRAHFQPGDSVLVQGASGAVGLAALQLARGLGASSVFGTAGSEKGRQIVKEMGAEAVFDYKDKDFREIVKATIGPKGVNVILETNVDVNFAFDLDIISKHGHIVIIGKHGITKCDPQNMVTKESTVTGSALFFCDTEARLSLHDTLYRGIEEGWLKPYIGGRFKLDDVIASHRDIETRKGATGKTILTFE
ncbi:quinone oxidoreductase [Strongylocentrotus purpuratus]|uniref:Enoyl reductase (ER) domain-containing protein n=1 Tax=Strongylocentrotus purpuratus TaxID=7668 RepID=A0A7M7RCH4_STRPU|nr:quinone oxidoreductase [Strongylocentrotus purpuratus]